MGRLNARSAKRRPCWPRTLASAYGDTGLQTWHSIAETESERLTIESGTRVESTNQTKVMTGEQAAEAANTEDRRRKQPKSRAHRRGGKAGLMSETCL